MKYILLLLLVFQTAHSKECLSLGQETVYCTQDKKFYKKVNVTGTCKSCENKSLTQIKELATSVDDLNKVFKQNIKE